MAAVLGMSTRSIQIYACWPSSTISAKVGGAGQILFKPGPLTNEEALEMQRTAK